MYHSQLKEHLDAYRYPCPSNPNETSCAKPAHYPLITIAITCLASVLKRPWALSEYIQLSALLGHTPLERTLVRGSTPIFHRLHLDLLYAPRVMNK